MSAGRDGGVEIIETLPLCQSLAIMEPEQTQRINEAVRRVIVDDFHSDFEEIYEIAYRFTGELLIQANNGVRNALSHLASALVSGNESEAELEVERARKHIAIAKYDCLLILIINRADYLDRYVETVEDLSGQIFIDLRRRLIEIKKEKHSIPTQNFLRVKTREELLSDINSIALVNDQIEELLIKCNEYEEYLKDTYPIPDPLQMSVVKIKAPAVRWVVQNIVWVMLLGVLVNVIAAIVYALWIENIVHPSLGSLNEENTPSISWPVAELSQEQPPSDRTLASNRVLRIARGQLPMDRPA
jgi:hypothetical protein